jgi:hypothetical protein
VNAHFTAGCRKGFRVWYSIGQRTISIAKLGFDVKGSSSFIWISSIGVSKMASRIINSGLADAHEASLQILLIFMIFFIFGLCVIFRLFHFHISIQSETALTAMQITI